MIGWEYFFRVYNTSSKDLGLVVFLKVMQTLSASGLYNCLEFSKPLSYLDEATWLPYNILYGLSIVARRCTLQISVLMSFLRWIYFKDTTHERTSPCNKSLQKSWGQVPSCELAIFTSKSTVVAGTIVPQIQTILIFWDKSLQLVLQNTSCELFVGQVTVTSPF